MNFFQRLFRKNYLSGINLVPVPKWTHAAEKGREVFCPRAGCRYPTRVYNFAWSALVCRACGATTDKYEWLIQSNQEEM